MRLTITLDVDGEAVQVATPLASGGRSPKATWVAKLPHHLTAREVEVLCLVATGMQYKQIADTLTISEKTVRSHITNAYGQTGIRNNTMLVTWAWLTGLLDEQDILRAWREIAPHLVAE